MSSVLDVLAEHELASSEDEIAAQLRVLLAAPTDSSAAGLTAAEEGFLAEFGGVPAASPAELRELDSRSTAHAVLEAADSRSRSEVATLLGIDQTRISHRTRAGALFSYPGASGRRRYPNWQFVGATVVPHLATALLAVPAGTHPVTLRTFMTTPDGSLQLDGKPASPVRWLVAGGSPDAVAALAPTLGEQV